jgi:hypothetical protein
MGFFEGIEQNVKIGFELLYGIFSAGFKANEAFFTDNKRLIFFFYLGLSKCRRRKEKKKAAYKK